MKDPSARNQVIKWRNATLWFIAVNIVNLLLFSGWAMLGWGLRGLAYEPGRPSLEDIWSVRIIYILLTLAITINLGGPIYFAIKRRWKTLGAFVAAWFTLPLVSIISFPVLNLFISLFR